MGTTRELDTRVAGEVFGVTDVHEALIPHYSTNLGDAWSIVEYMARRGYEAAVIEVDGIWRGWFRKRNARACPECGLRKDISYTVEEDTAPLAICKAALAAVGSSTEEGEK